MNTRHISKASCGLLLVALAAGMVGCATSGHERSASMASSLQSSATKIDRAGLDLDTTFANLNDLVNNPQPDLRPQFKKFTGALKNLDSSSANIARAHDKLQVKSTSYFENWERETSTIQNKDIREESAQRKQQVARQFDRTKANCEELRTRIKPLVTDLKDIQKSLSSDLTTGGLAAIKDTVHKVNEQAAPRREETNALAAQFRELAAAVSPKGASVK